MSVDQAVDVLRSTNPSPPTPTVGHRSGSRDSSLILPPGSDPMVQTQAWLHETRLAVSFSCLHGRDGECKNKSRCPYHTEMRLDFTFVLRDFMSKQFLFFSTVLKPVNVTGKLTVLS